MGSGESFRDPFIEWMQESLFEMPPGDDAVEREMLGLQRAAATLDAEISGLPRTRHGVEIDVAGVTLPPRWLENWLTFHPDLEHKVEVLEQDTKSNIALIDNTSIDLVSHHFESGEPPTALGLLDLANFVNNLVLRDELVALDHPLGTKSTFARLIGQEVGPARIGERDQAIIGGALLWIRELSGGDPKYSPERAETVRTWSIILEEELSADQIFDVPLEDALRYLNAGEQTDTRVLTKLLINDLYSLTPYEYDNSSWRIAAIQASNCRSLLNLEAERHLGIPYAGGITRTPMKRLLWSRGRRAYALLSAFGKPTLSTPMVLDNAFRKRVSAALEDNEQSIVLPVFLSAVLSRIDTCQQFFECTDDLRQQAAPLRRRLASIEQALAGEGHQREVRKLMAAFADDCHVLQRTVWDLLPAASAVAGIVLTAATGQPQWLTAVLAMLKAPEKMQRRTWERLINHIWRRDLWFVTELGQICDEFSTAGPRLERLWGPYLDQSDLRRRLETLKQLGTI